jgi:hypothetical protein
VLEGKEILGEDKYSERETWKGIYSESRTISEKQIKVGRGTKTPVFVWVSTGKP